MGQMLRRTDKHMLKLINRNKNNALNIFMKSAESEISKR